MSDLFRLDGQLAVVTGASRGLGLAMAEALAEAGADVVGVSRTMDPADSEAARRVRAAGRTFTGYACDFEDRRAVEALAEQLATGARPVDILVNNAGSIFRAPAAHYPLAEWDRLMEVNVTAQFILAQRVGRAMTERGRGKIIFVASLLAFQGGILVPAYAAGKGAVLQLTKALANEWAGSGVQVNALVPGYMETDNTAPLRADPERSAAISARIPAGRWGRPDDLKGPIVFLASAASDYVNGAALVVDGGWLAR